VDALQAILSKRDTRSFRADPIEDDALGRVLQAARMAGSAKNAQVTRIIVVTDADIRGRLRACGDFASWVDKAPAVLVFVIPINGGRLFDVGRAAQNAMLAAHALGLASCPVTFHHQPRITEVLGIPSDHEAPMGVGLGWPPEAESGVRSRVRRLATAAVSPRGPRLPLETLVHRDRWSG
jgi:nitroreductase